MRQKRVHITAVLALTYVFMTGCGSARHASHADKEVEEFNIENPATARIMACSDASFNGETSTPMTQGQYQTANAETSYRSDQPAMKTISFECKSPKTHMTASVFMSRDKAFKDVILMDTISLSKKENGIFKGSYTFRNMVPGQTFHYMVCDGKTGGHCLAKGSFRATGQLRMIGIDDGFNIRDLGGWKGLGGRTLRYESIYRGGSLGGTDMYGATDGTLSEEAAKELRRIGIRAQLDLRAATDEGKYAGEKSFHSYARDYTTLSGADYCQTQTDYGAYNEDASVISDIAWIIYELRNGRPVYFNCRQGADRTGTIAFVIEGLTGCFQAANSHGANQMAIDYELTSFSRAELVDKAARANSGIRGSDEAFSSKGKLFRKLMYLEADDVTFRHSYDDEAGNTKANMLAIQERCYYYLNRYWSTHEPHGGSNAVNSAVCIDDDDIDWFIRYMLGLSEREYARFKPSWARSWDGTEVAGQAYDLRHIGEANAKVVRYSSE